jgi:ATP synthase subunit 6
VFSPFESSSIVWTVRFEIEDIPFKIFSNYNIYSTISENVCNHFLELSSFIFTNTFYSLIIISIVFMLIILNYYFYTISFTLSQLFFIIQSFLYNLIDSFVDIATDFFFTFFSFAFFFVLLFNLVGLLPLQFALNSHFIITFSIAFFFWGACIGLGFLCNGLRYLAVIVPGNVPSMIVLFLLLIEFVSYIFRVVSLALRLFANVLSGHILLHVVANAISSTFLYSLFGINFIFFFINLISMICIIIVFSFESIVSFLQAYIFIVLSLIYNRDVLALPSH